jgi:hypothetical protein
MLGDEQIEEMVMTTLKRQPADATHWYGVDSPRTWACESRRWADLEGVQPHLVDTFRSAMILTSSTRSRRRRAVSALAQS